MSLLSGTPALSVDEVAAALARVYGLEAELEPLPSERDQNFKVTTETATYLLRIFSRAEHDSFVDAHAAVLARLRNAEFGLAPQVVPAPSGPTVGIGDYRAQLLTWRPGRTMAAVRYRSPGLFRHLGHVLGELDAALAEFDHPGVHRSLAWDLAAAPETISRHRPEIADAGAARIVDAVVARFQEHVQPHLAGLRRSVIHNDANDRNLICGGSGGPWTRHQQIVGIVDFGDMVQSYTVADPAVALAYAMLDADDPLAAAAAVIAGYDHAYRLSDTEFAVLWGMAKMRLALSVTLAAHQSRLRPHDEYLVVSQGPIRRLLDRIVPIPDTVATTILRQAAGRGPQPRIRHVTDYLATVTPAPVLGQALTSDNATLGDAGVACADITGDPTAFDPDAIGLGFVDDHRGRAGVPYAVGPYGEARLIYTHPMFATGAGPLDERRTIHLGVDLFADAGTAVHAILDAEVEMTLIADQPQDYGCAVVLRHSTNQGTLFWTLYGHLSAGSLPPLEPGTAVAAGDAIGRVGEPHENGRWAPHVHVQIFTEPLAGSGFPGVAPASQRAGWQAISPDPMDLAGVPPSLRPRPSQASEDLRRRVLGPSVRLSYRRPIPMARGWMEWMWDETGRRYLDAYNNVPHIGHSHPAVVEAVTRQARVLNTNTRYLHDTVNHYAERLIATAPDPLGVCFLVNSASEANELALRLARAATRRHHMVVLEGAYHGHTTTLIDLSPYKHDGPGGSGAPDWVHVAPLPDLYRGRYRSDHADPVAAYVADTQRAIDQAGDRLAGFIAETCPSVGGQIILPGGYLPAVYDRVRTAGGLVIADEVQTGFGRTGLFYAFEHDGVVPDILVLGKPIANGMPLGAVLTTREIASAFDTGMEFFSTFGGNPVSAAAGLAVLGVVAEEGLVAHAQAVGAHLIESLEGLSHRLIGDVRGRGLFVGVELVGDALVRTPATAEAEFVVNRLRDRGILTGTDGPDHNVIKIRPPMPFDRFDVDLLVDHLGQTLDELD